MSNYNKIFKGIVDRDPYMIVRRMTRTERTARMTMMAVRRISSLARLGGSSTSMAASPPRFRFMSPCVSLNNPRSKLNCLSSEHGQNVCSRLDGPSSKQRLIELFGKWILPLLPGPPGIPPPPPPPPSTPLYERLWAPGGVGEGGV
jgi:hypothetical protein